MTIEESTRKVMARYRWDITDVQVLDEERCVWMALAETTHLEKQERFAILVHGWYDMAMPLELATIPALGGWCLEHQIILPK
jgi:hypothetical protein